MGKPERTRRFGVTHEWLTQAKGYWLNKYDEHAEEKRFNSFSSHKMKIKDDIGGSMQIHFVGMFSEKKDAIPNVCMRGWPGASLNSYPCWEC